MGDARPELASPMVMLAPDVKTAEQWAYAENVARRDLSPADEIRAYGKMQAAGSTPAAIARSFAVTEKHVYRRLALASLPSQVIDALAASEINLSMAACFTICEDEKHSLEVLERVWGEQWSDYQLKNMLKPDSVKGTDRRAIFSGDETMSFVAHKRGQNWRVSHLAIGLCVDHGTTSRAETVKGFKDAVEYGLFDLAALAHICDTDMRYSRGSRCSRRPLLTRCAWPLAR